MEEPLILQWSGSVKLQKIIKYCRKTPGIAFKERENSLKFIEWKQLLRNQGN